MAVAEEAAAVSAVNAVPAARSACRMTERGAGPPLLLPLAAFGVAGVDFARSMSFWYIHLFWLWVAFAEKLLIIALFALSFCVFVVATPS